MPVLYSLQLIVKSINIYRNTSTTKASSLTKRREIETVPVTQHETEKSQTGQTVSKMVKVHVIRCKKRKYGSQFDALQKGLENHFAREQLQITSEKTDEKLFEVYINDELVFSKKNGDGKLDSGDKVARIFQSVRVMLKHEKANNNSTVSVNTQSIEPLTNNTNDTMNISLQDVSKRVRSRLRGSGSQ